MARILVVEDDDSTLTLIVRHLRKHGHRAEGVTCGRDALDLVHQKGVPDVVVLDIGLPDTDGRELLVALRQRTGAEHLPPIFLSSRVDENDVQSGRALGARYLTKPVVLSALLDAVDRSVPAARGW